MLKSLPRVARAVSVLAIASAFGCSTPYARDAGIDVTPADGDATEGSPSDSQLARDVTGDPVASDVTPPVDADGDGSPAGVDCDDTDPARHPGARERCNGVDDDCNGATDDGGACQLHYLARGSSRWEAYPLDAVHDADPTRTSPDAPQPGVPIREALDLEAPGVAYVVTDTTYHLLDLVSRAWIEHGSRDSLAPQMMGRTVLTGYSVPAALSGPTATTEGVTFFGTDATYFYNVDTVTRAWGYVQTTPPPSDWTNADAPSLATLRWAWLDINNAEGWVTIRPVDVCPARSNATTVSVYGGVVDANGVHLYDVAGCGTFVAHMPYEQFPPFQLPGAPAFDTVVTAFYRSGLWLITR